MAFAREKSAVASLILALAPGPVHAQEFRYLAGA